MVERLEDRTVPSAFTVQNLNDSGNGSLRWAIEQSNANGGDDTIDFSIVGTIALKTVLPELNDSTGSTVIEGPGPSLLTVTRSDAAETPYFCIFTVPKGAEVKVGGLTVDGGVFNFRETKLPGGAGIFSAGSLTVTHCTFTRNSASGVPYGEPGGGIYNSGNLTVDESTLSGNFASNGGGIYNTGTLSVNNSTLSGNGAGFGGGIYNSGMLTVNNSTFSDNGAGGFSILSAGTPGSGGGIYNWGTLAVKNSTFSGNSAGAWRNYGGSGGGIYSTGTLTLANSTLSGNSADEGRGDFGTPDPGRGGGVYSAGTTMLTMNIFNNSIGGNLQKEGDGLRSLGYNLFSDAPVVTLDPTDQVSTAPLLGPLNDNGGPTWTMALLPDSPAIDAGALVSDVTVDQRGEPRPQSYASDIGAFESSYSRSPTNNGSTPTTVPIVKPPTVLLLQRHGIRLKPTTLVVSFSQAMDAPSAESPANYRIVSAGLDHRFGTRDDRFVHIRSIRYNPTTHTVTLRPIHRLPLRRTFELTISGTPPAGLMDSAGVFLDGVGTVQAGKDYVARINARLLVPPIHHTGARDATVR